jgi:hypothetical protein
MRGLTANPVFQTILLVWHPNGVSHDFPKLHQELEDAVSRFRATRDPVLRRHLLAEMRRLSKEAETPVIPYFAIEANAEP